VHHACLAGVNACRWMGWAALGCTCCILHYFALQWTLDRDAHSFNSGSVEWMPSRVLVFLMNSMHAYDACVQAWRLRCVSSVSECAWAHATGLSHPLMRRKATHVTAGLGPALLLVWQTCVFSFRQLFF
jgi:hypothetical protein